MSYPHFTKHIDPFINLKDDPAYSPKLADKEKIKDYKVISPTGAEMKAHIRDNRFPEPKILRPNGVSDFHSLDMDAVSDFPKTETAPLQESYPYQEGKYRPASMPVYSGYYPINVYLYRGKKYDWCSCGHTWNAPFCSNQCKWILTRNRPISFNVSESGYYKLCNCKMSSNAPFCNGTHKLVYKWIMKSNKGFFHFGNYMLFFFVAGYWGVNWYH